MYTSSAGVQCNDYYHKLSLLRTGTVLILVKHKTGTGDIEVANGVSWSEISLLISLKIIP